MQKLLNYWLLRGVVFATFNPYMEEFVVPYNKVVFGQ